jgi:hypothetical protein
MRPLMAASTALRFEFGVSSNPLSSASSMGSACENALNRHLRGQMWMARKNDATGGAMRVLILRLMRLSACGPEYPSERFGSNVEPVRLAPTDFYFDLDVLRLAGRLPTQC